MWCLWNKIIPFLFVGDGYNPGEDSKTIELITLTSKSLTPSMRIMQSTLSSRKTNVGLCGILLNGQCALIVVVTRRNHIHL
jgi:hypothetical protein